MTVELKLYGSLKKYAKSTTQLNHQIELPPNTSINDMITFVGIPSEIIGIILLDGKYCYPDSTIRDGSIVSLFPFAGGG
jgi:hypothetical protein